MAVQALPGSPRLRAAPGQAPGPLCKQDGIGPASPGTQKHAALETAELLLVTQRRQCLENPGLGNHKGLYFPLPSPKFGKKKKSGSWSLVLALSCVSLTPSPLLKFLSKFWVPGS